MEKALPQTAQAVSVDRSRITVPAKFEQTWFPGASESYFIPLRWRRVLLLPDELGLEAWYLWNQVIPGHEEVPEVSLLLERQVSDELDEESNDLLSLAFPADIYRHGKGRRQWRVRCRGLITDLSERNQPLLGNKVVVHKEIDSISLWTLRAYETHFGRLRLV